MTKPRIKLKIPKDAPKQQPAIVSPHRSATVFRLAGSTTCTIAEVLADDDLTLVTRQPISFNVINHSNGDTEYVLQPFMLFSDNGIVCFNKSNIDAFAKPKASLMAAYAKLQTIPEAYFERQEGDFVDAMYEAHQSITQSNEFRDLNEWDAASPAVN